MFLEKRLGVVSRGNLSMVWRLSDSAMTFYVFTRQKDGNQFRDIICTRSITKFKIF